MKNKKNFTRHKIEQDWQKIDINTANHLYEKAEGAKKIYVAFGESGYRLRESDLYVVPKTQYSLKQVAAVMQKRYYPNEEVRAYYYIFDKVSDPIFAQPE